MESGTGWGSQTKSPQAKTCSLPNFFCVNSAPGHFVLHRNRKQVWGISILILSISLTYLFNWYTDPACHSYSLNYWFSSSKTQHYPMWFHRIQTQNHGHGHFSRMPGKIKAALVPSWEHLPYCHRFAIITPRWISECWVREYASLVVRWFSVR